MSALQSQPLASHHELRRLLDDTAHFEMSHALRLYCHAHKVDGALANFMLECSDAAMRRADLLTLRVNELAGRPRLPHLHVPKVPTDARVELMESMAAAQRYERMGELVSFQDDKTQGLLAHLRGEHLRESAHFARLLQTKLD